MPDWIYVNSAIYPPAARDQDRGNSALHTLIAAIAGTLDRLMKLYAELAGILQGSLVPPGGT
jgi:hypothetical protein